MRSKFYPVIVLISLVASLLFAGTGVASPALGPETPYNPVTVAAANNGGTVMLGENDMLVVTLEVNPATGYRWEVQNLDTNVLARAKGPALEVAPSKTTLLGAPTTQILRFYGVGKGSTTLNLVYRQPWVAENPNQPLQTYSVQVESAGAFKGTYVPSDSIMAAATAAPATEAPATQVPVGTLALPTHYNVCENGGCTPVKNQGSCGSCWSFGTVGVMESAILVADGVTRDLSEQYLVSCNSDGFGCDGGWWAHDYHVSKIPSGESAAGAVYEADRPYTGTDAACNGPHTHHEKLSSWAYIGTQSSVPTAAAIKQAIYDHGAVAAAVCVGTAFQNYTSGIFQTNECSQVNHAIILTGWDDTQGVWYLRNSWGPEWGENGYMRIKYGTSAVGYAANYVIYNNTPPPAGDYLLVDDDAGKTYQTYYANALTALGKTFTTWTVASQGSPTAATMQKYKAVIWLTGDDYSTTLDATDITALTTYLNGGGKLFISGQDLGYNLKSNTFYANYLHASFVNDDTNVTTLSGADFMNGVALTIAGGDGANNQSYPSEISAVNGGVALFDYTGTPGLGGVAYAGTYKVAYLSFGFEAINSATARNTVMDKVLAWLGGNVGPTPTNTPTNTPTATPTLTPPPSKNILLVDDDAGKTYQTYYANSLTALNKSFDTWTVASQGSPTAATLQKYKVVIWLTGDDYSASLTATDTANLTTFLNGGGNLFISGQDLGYDIRTDTGNFYGNYLHASYVRDDTNTTGLTGAGILSGVSVTISAGDGANNQNYQSEISPLTGATGVFDYSGTTYGYGGVSFSNTTYKTVYFSFGFEGLNSATSRNTVMSKILTWFGY